MNWNTSTASAPVDDTHQDAIDEVAGSEAFAAKFVIDNLQTFYELLDRKAGPLGDASIVRAVRKLEAERNTLAEQEVSRAYAERAVCAAEFNREALEDR